MNKLWEQLKFDGKRLVFRNPSFLIMSLGMPAFFTGYSLNYLRIQQLITVSLPVVIWEV
ncbi:hypothetical protein [Pediococcus acidilactici]|uniref:hypothetical protein n=1 Tax=Pediococcus acidilactici TaxID=1254 RepID=UPI0004BA9DCD|nr:hypothetical protein [Pediococcus acidilactici]MCF4060613.1 hypothetical protein [Pediococcus acidilactici]MCJ2191445.1 hypothetical protein [Pediococcus acidilactici]